MAVLGVLARFHPDIIWLALHRCWHDPVALAVPGPAFAAPTLPAPDAHYAAAVMKLLPLVS